MGALSSSPTSLETAPLAGISMLATSGGVSFILGVSDASLAVGRSMWIDLLRAPIRGRVRGGRRIETQEQGGVGVRGWHAPALECASAGNGEPLTGGRPLKYRSGS